MNNHTEIIIVEDNLSDADLILRVLRKNRLANSIIHLKDGQEAIDYFSSDDNFLEDQTTRPQIIFLDLKMPKVNGIEVLRQIKSDEKTKTIPVVILTSSKEDPDIAECYQLGVNSYVVKPVAFEDFVKAVTQIGLYWLMVNEPIK